VSKDKLSKLTFKDLAFRIERLDPNNILQIHAGKTWPQDHSEAVCSLGIK
jgi:hypothetical protein